jgi:FKBP-type peptidyl-prolyl cis-trans isomerase (trigger factor)
MGINVSTDAELVKYINEGLSYELLMIAIIQAEDIKVTDEEYQMMLDSLVKQTGKTEAEVLEIYSEEYIRQQLALNEVGNVIYKLNTFVLKTEE